MKSWLQLQYFSNFLLVLGIFWRFRFVLLKDQWLFLIHQEIEVKRVLYQSGESEYFINNTKVRLKDITDLFLDTGAGASSFNIISQGSVSEVINSKPFDRRSIFEEAAGVLKYKKHIH